MKAKIINWILSLYLKSIVKRVGGIEDFTSKLKDIENVVVFEGKDKTTIFHPDEKWTITIRTDQKNILKGKPPKNP